MKQKWKRPLALLLSVAMMFSMSGTPVYAADMETGASAVCPHHVHDETCGYSEGTPCTHEHTDDCYTLVTQCVHEHTAECYSDGILPAEGEEKAADACTHVCSEESGCITKELNCPHVHDETCGYSEGSPCTFGPADCEICNPTDSGEPEAPAECICETLCTEGVGNLNCPVCTQDIAACQGEAPAECTCETLCTEDSVDPDCPVCGAEGADLADCTGAAPALLAKIAQLSKLVVGGTTVVENSQTTENTSGQGWSYDVDSNILTLDNATINGTDTIGHVGAGIFASGDLTIVLEGSSTVKGVQDPNGETQSIRVEGNLTIQGGGSLTAQGAETSSGSSYGIFVIGSFTQQGGSVTASGGNVSGNYNSTGLYVYGSTVTVQGGTLTATGGTTGSGSYGISANGSVTVSDATVTATGGTGKYSYGLYVSSNSPSVTLSDSGSLTARSGSATSKASGIYFQNPFGSTGSVTVGNGSTLLTNSVIRQDMYNTQNPLAPTGDGSWLIYGQSNQTSAVGGTYTLEENLTIENGNTFTIPAGSTLNLGGHTLTNNGTLNIANQSSLAGEGTLAGSGTFNLTNPEPVISGSETLTYDGTDQFNNFSLTLPTDTVEVLNHEFTISSSATIADWSLETKEIKNAGNYTLTAKNGTRTIEKEVTVNPATISITSATVQDKTYDGNTDATVESVTFEDLVNGESLSFGTDYTATAVFNSANAGSQSATVTVTLKGGSNYTFAGNQDEATYDSATGTISPLPVVLEWETTSFTYDGSAKTVTAKVSNAVDGDTFTLTYEGNTGTAVGNYTAKVTAIDNTNYTLTGATGVELTWSIGEASITEATVELSETEFTYTGQSQKPTVTVKLGNQTLTENTDYTVTYDGDTINAGTVKVTVTGTGNYSGTAESKTYTIKPVTVTPSISGTASKTYDGTTAAPAGLTITLEGVLSGDTVTATASFAYDSADAGESKTVTASNITLSGEDAGNYTLSATSAQITGTITRASLAVTADAKSKTYGDADPELTYTTTGLVGGDKLTGELSRAEGENVGDYAITQGTLAAGDNYTLAFTGANLTITARPVTLSWSTPTSFTYDGSEHSVTAQVSNAVNGDTFTLTYENNAKTDVGNYTAKVTGLGNTNYTLTGATGVELTWSIGGASIAGATVTLSPESFTYDGNSHTPTVTVKLGDKTLTENTDYTVTYDGDTTNAGEVTVTVTGTGNYSGEANQTPSYTISKADQAALSITSSGPATFGQNYTLTTSGGSGSGAVTFTVTDGTDVATIEGSTLTPIKTGTVTVTAVKAGDNNYNDGTSVSATITINKGTYDGTTTATGSVLANWPGEVELPGLPDGASYGEPSSNDVTGMSITGGVLHYTGGSGIQANQQYTVTVPVAGATNYNDYQITVTLTGTDKKVLTITGVTAQNGTYNGQTQAGYTGTPRAQGYTGDFTVTYNTTDGKAPTNAGNYAVTIAIPDSDPQYVGSIVLEFAIAKKPLTVSAPSASVYVGDNAPELALTYTGLVDGESMTPSEAPAFTITKSDDTEIALADAVKTAGTYTITWSNANDTTFTGVDNYDITLKNTGTLTVTVRSSGGGGSSSGSGNKTETTTNPDGSTTTTVTSSNGTVTETTKFPDGSKEVVETKKDGTVTTTTTDTAGNKTQVVENTDGSSKTTVDNKDGSGSVTVVDENGQVVSEATLSQSAVAAAQEKGEAVVLPMPEVPVTTDRETAPTVTVSLHSGTSAKVEIPVENVTPGTVAVIVKADGTEEVIKTSLTTETGVAVTLSDGDTVKIVDNSKTFEDVSATYWGAEAVAFASSRELFAGTSATTFAPDTAMTRAMIVTVLARFEGVDTTTGSTWYEAGQQWAVANGVSDGSSMDQGLSREQLATMLWRYAGSPSVSNGLSNYTDAGTVSSYAQQAMAWCVEQGIIGGTTTTTLSPQGPATRAQVATILMRFIEVMA